MEIYKTVSPLCHTGRIVYGWRGTDGFNSAGIMSQIVDDGVLGLNNGGVGNLNLIWKLGLYMIGLVLFGGLCGSLNNVFVHLSGQNIGNEIRKDCFRNIMTFSFPSLINLEQALW